MFLGLRWDSSATFWVYLRLFWSRIGLLSDCLGSMRVLSAVTLSSWVLQTVVEVLVPGLRGALECMQGPEFSGYHAARSPAELGFQGFASHQAHIGLTDTCAETQCYLFGSLQCLPLSWSVRHLERGSMPWRPLSPFS